MMNPEKDREFDQNINQLVALLKKLLKNIPPFGGQHPSSPFPPAPGKDKDSTVNLNFCFFTFLPISPEEMDEFEEIYEQSIFQDEREEFSAELSPADIEFLRLNGIRF